MTAPAPVRGMLLAAAERRIAVFFALRSTRVSPLRGAGQQRRPVIVVVGDALPSTGPGGWAAAAEIVCWAGRAIVRGGQAEPEHYAQTLEMTTRTSRVLLVETTIDMIEPWRSCISAARPTMPLSTMFAVGWMPVGDAKVAP